MKERKKFEVIKALSEIMQKFNVFKDVLFTIVDIKLPKKGGYLRVYLSVFPEEKEK
jgi:ribosome-binding factor A